MTTAEGLNGLGNTAFSIVPLVMLVIWLGIIAVSIVVLVLLVRFLIKGTKAFDIYIEKNNKI